MIKILDCKNKNYISELTKLLIKRKNNDKISKNLVKKIINDVKKNGDKALIKYEKKYSNNDKIIPWIQPSILLENMNRGAPQDD